MEEEIDLDALLEAQSSDEEEGDLPELERSIEDILNEADEGESTDGSDGSEETVVVESVNVVEMPEVVKQDRENGVPNKRLQGNSTSSCNWRNIRLGEGSSRVMTTSTTTETTTSPSFSLFEGVSLKPSLRPGDALAAATAASRQLRSSRLSFERPPVVTAVESVPGTKTQETVAVDEADTERETFTSIVDEDGRDVEATSLEDEVDAATEESGSSSAEGSEKNIEVEPYVLVTEEAQEEITSLQAEVHQGSRGEKSSDESELHEEQKPSGESELRDEVVEASSSSNSSVEAEEDLLVVEVLNELNERRVDDEDSDSEAEVVEVVQEESAVSALDAAEEMEKRAANSGMHLEEGAAAQPMQLEGIQRGPPAIGLLKLDWWGPLSSTLSAPATVQDHGTPRALAVHSNYIAVGMSKGAILLTASRYSATSTADDNENRVAVLSNNLDKSGVAVSVLAFSNLWDLLLVGYSNGTVALWDVTKAAVVRALNDHHRSSVVHAAFVCQDASTGRLSKAITADCRGVVMLHTFVLVPLLRLYTVTTQCITDGQKTGIVLSLSPLVSNVSGPLNSSSSSGSGPVDAGKKFLYDGSSDEAGGLVALVAQQSVLVFRFAPAVGLYAKLARPQGVPDGCIPYTAWRGTIADKESSSQGSEDKHPLLALAWGKKVLVLQVRKGELKTFREWELESKASGIAWLGEQMLLVPTGKAELLLFTKEGVKLEQVPILDGQGREAALTFHTNFLEFCNNPEKVYANSVGVRGAAFYILGASRLWRARLLPWQDRIKALQDAGDWMGAFQIAMELFDGRARGVTGLPSGLSALQAAILPSLIGLLLSYVDEAFAYVQLALRAPDGISGPTEAGIEQYARVGRVAIEFCVHIHRTDVLFEKVFTKFDAEGQAETFLELLEPYILKDMLCGLAPEIMQSLVEHYSRKGWLQRIEQCILHMEISSLDFNQVMRLCREHGLYSAMIYLYNKGLNDFISPLDQLLAAVQDQRRANANFFGYKLLVYLKYCFSGLLFPPGRGTLNPQQFSRVKTQLLEYLLDPAGSGMETTYAVFPRLHYLLNLDVVATLDVFNLALNGEYTEKNQNEKDLIQLTIDALVHIIEAVLSMDTGSKCTIDHILLFIAGIVSVGGASIPPATLHRILELFLDSKDRERENLIVSLLKAVPEENWDTGYVLELAEKAHFWQVSALAHLRKRDYVSALKSHLKDSSRPHCTFLYAVSKLEPDNGLQPDVLTEFRNAVISNFPQLVEQDGNGALFLLLNYFGNQVQHVMKSLDEFPSILFCFLRAVLEVHSGNLRELEGDYPWNDRSRLVRLLDNSRVTITDEMVEQYIELLCQFDPPAVLSFLHRYENYRLDKCLKLCQKYSVKDGSAYLLERVGDVGSALTLTLSDLSEMFHELDHAVAARRSPSKHLPEEKRLYTVKEAAVLLCQRNTFRIDPQEAESLWFHLLDRFIHPLQALAHNMSRRSSSVNPSHYEWRVLRVEGAANVLRNILSKLAGEVVQGMVGYVPLQVVLNKIVSDHGNHELGDFKATILEMLGAYGYEVAILGTAQRIIATDMFHNVELLRRGLSRGIGPRSLRCCVCNLALRDTLGGESQGSTRAVQIFSCGHAAHLNCMQEVASSVRCPVCVQDELYEVPSRYSFSRDEDRIEVEEVEKTSAEEPASTSTARKNELSMFETFQKLQRGETLPVLNTEVKLKLAPSKVYKHRLPNNRSKQNQHRTKRPLQWPLQQNQNRRSGNK